MHVHYPPDAGRLVLRTELDWETDVRGEPTADGAVFEVEAEQPWLYFKSCLEHPGGFTWEPGLNRLAEPYVDGVHIWPFFFSPERGTLTEPAEVDGLRYRVYLPAGYAENPLARHPVVYMHDGANLFLPGEAFHGNEWRVDETLDQLDALNVIDQAIVVGVYPGDRMAAYTNPGCRDFARRCATELLPQLDRTLRTRVGPENTVVMGSSLGGVISLYMAWEWPEVFGGAACLSATFGVLDDLFERLEEGPKRPIRVYLDSGWPQDNFERTAAMRDLLLRRGYQNHAEVLYLVFPGATHSESA